MNMRDSSEKSRIGDDTCRWYCDKCDEPYNDTVDCVEWNEGHLCKWCWLDTQENIEGANNE